MKLSIVTTLYCSVLTIEEFHARMSHVAKQLVGDDYEIIMVNDGSPDQSIELATTLFHQDQHLTVIDLSRNFGHHLAVMTGLQYASGEYVFALDDDLEEEPEWLIAFWEELQRTQADVIYGVQQTRKGKFFERWSGAAFYKLFNCLSDVKIIENQIMAKLMTRRFVYALLHFKERNIFLAGILALTGFQQCPLVCKKTSKGRTTYTLAKKIEQSINSLTSFSTKPLYAIFYLGILITTISFFFLSYVIIQKLIIGTILDGWTSLMAVMTFGFGIVTAILGIIGLYLAKIFIEVKQRPYTIVKQILCHK